MKPNPFQALPDTVTVGGRPVPVDTDFRVGVSIEQESLAAEPDVVSLLVTFYKGMVPFPAMEASKAMLKFYSHSDSSNGKGDGDKVPKRSYDFEQDRDALDASFLESYGIDLDSAKIHWWKFKRLMCNLPPETPFMRRIYYRTADTKKMSKAEKKHVEKMRRLYALKAPERAGKSAEELDKAFLDWVNRRFEEAQRVARKTP